MKDMEYDVVVVGAGPGGSSAARFLSEKGVKVLVLEKRQEIGAPKRCAEGLNRSALEDLGVPISEKFTTSNINGAVLYSPKGKKVVMDKVGDGFVLERKVFEKHLAALAIRKGAKYMVKTTVTDVIKDGGRVVGVKANFMDEEFMVKAKIVIAADGVDSMTAKRAGINTVNRLSDYHSGFQYEMAGITNMDAHKLHIFFGNDVAPKGYVWIFPKGDDVANVGIGIVGIASEDGKRARDYLDKFIANNPEFFAKASPIEVNSGGIPVSASAKSFVSDGFMVVGDAAQQVNPIHGGGIAIAMYAGKIAGEVAAKALKEGDVSAKRLSEYEKIWRDDEGKRLETLLKLRTFLERLEDEDFERLAEVISGDDIMKLTVGDYGGLPKLLAKMPKLLPLAKKLF
ncbi:MAG: NAD(P)/FAD-dependent oxidoreductase [Candidatus Altiarchaeota archaeon]|nr:NAD(P)/FAD-dependent oxidoreductase [Candidatus Altiarchaeota archaeon]